MKRFTVLVVVAVIVALAGSAMAIDLGGAVKDTAAKVAKTGAATGINKELEKGKYQCTWNATTKDVEGCNLNEIAAYLSIQRKATESAGSAAGSYTDYNIYINAKDYNAYTTVKDKLKSAGVGSWDIMKGSGAGNKMNFTVAIQ